MVRDQVKAATLTLPQERELSPWARWTGGIPAGRPDVKGLALSELESLCDDPARDDVGGENVRAILTLEPEDGFYLAAVDGEITYLVTDSTGRRQRWRTIEAALGVLHELDGLDPDIGLLQAQRKRGAR